MNFLRSFYFLSSNVDPLLVAGVGVPIICNKALFTLKSRTMNRGHWHRKETNRREERIEEEESQRITPMVCEVRKLKGSVYATCSSNKIIHFHAAARSGLFAVRSPRSVLEDGAERVSSLEGNGVV